MLKLNKKLQIILSIVIFSGIVFSCSSNNDELFFYEKEDFKLIGWKQKGSFEKEFVNSTFAKWGYIRGSEVAIILYENPEIADSQGNIEGSDQTEILDEPESTDLDSGDTGSFYGPKVEKTTSRGFDKITVFRGECPRREPLFTAFKVDGNALIMIEPLRTENQESTKLRLDQLIENLKKKINR